MMDLKDEKLVYIQHQKFFTPLFGGIQKGVILYFII